MLNVFLRAVFFGLGVEVGREIYRAVKERTSRTVLPTTEEKPAAPAKPRGDDQAGESEG